MRCNLFFQTFVTPWSSVCAFLASLIVSAVSLPLPVLPVVTSRILPFAEDSFRGPSLTVLFFYWLQWKQFWFRCISFSVSCFHSYLPLILHECSGHPWLVVMLVVVFSCVTWSACCTLAQHVAARGVRAVNIVLSSVKELVAMLWLQGLQLRKCWSTVEAAL